MAEEKNQIYSLARKRVWGNGHRGMVGSALVRRLESEERSDDNPAAQRGQTGGDVSRAAMHKCIYACPFGSTSQSSLTCVICLTRRRLAEPSDCRAKRATRLGSEERSDDNPAA